MPTSAAKKKPKKTTKKRNNEEKTFQLQIIALARKYNWDVYSVPDSRTVTSKGFPDLILMHSSKKLIIAAELKTEKGRVTKEQHKWLTGFRQHVPTYIWRPNQFNFIKHLLKHGDLPNTQYPADVVKR